MLAVDRQQRRPAVGDDFHERRAADDERLLVREQNALAGGSRGKCRAQARGAHDRRDDGVGVRKARGFDEPGLARENARRQAGAAERGLEPRCCGGVGQHGDIGPMDEAEPRELFPLAVRRERGDAESVRMATDDVERRVADRSGRAEHAYLAANHRR